MLIEISDNKLYPPTWIIRNIYNNIPSTVIQNKHCFLCSNKIPDIKIPIVITLANIDKGYYEHYCVCSSSCLESLKKIYNYNDFN